MLRSFFMEVPIEVEEAAKIDGCSWWGVLTRVILPLSLPGLAVTVILGFMFSWNAFNYPLMLAGRQTFPATGGAIQFISYDKSCEARWRNVAGNHHAATPSEPLGTEVHRASHGRSARRSAG
jgi:ABC-type glycerol-3-phosphate transport system permease component